jgi:pSer/pThr/pTyr-binding forkhead associated (FHA) protein
MSAEESQTVAGLPWGSALLVMRRGPLTGERFLLDADRVTAGRSEQADIFLDDVTVSRKHAEFVHDGATYTVRDIGSLNGTYVNRNRIDAVGLSTGDEVQIGKFRMTFYASQAADPSGANPA